MKLKLSLLLFFLLGIGAFSHAQDKKKPSNKPKVENGDDAIPVTVTGKKKGHPLPPPPPPPRNRNEKPSPPAKLMKEGDKIPPPPPPARPVKEKHTLPVQPDAPPHTGERA